MTSQNSCAFFSSALCRSLAERGQGGTCGGVTANGDVNGGGNDVVALPSCPMFTWSLGCTGSFEPIGFLKRPSCEQRLAMTSLTFHVRRKCRCPSGRYRLGSGDRDDRRSLPCAARAMRSTRSFGRRRPSSRLAWAQEALMRPEGADELAPTKPRPETGRLFKDGALGGGAIEGNFGGYFHRRPWRSFLSAGGVTWLQLAQTGRRVGKRGVEGGVIFCQLECTRSRLRRRTSRSAAGKKGVSDSTSH